MLLEHQIKSHIKTQYLPSVIASLPHNYDHRHGILTLTVKLDFIKTLRNHREIALFIVGNFTDFYQLVENCLLEMLEQSNLKAPTYGINLSIYIHNCSLPRHNLESVEFLSSMFMQGTGILIYLKDSRVIFANQPECYLSSWSEVWESSCKCSQKQQVFKRKQRLIDIVRAKSSNLKEAVVLQIPRCSQCQSKLKLIKAQDEVYINCQKLRILTIMKTGNSKDEIYHTGETDIYVDHAHTSRLKVGDTVDICAYFSAEAALVKCPSGYLPKIRKSAYMVCYYPVAKRTSLNSAFFSRLTTLSCEYIHCPDVYNKETISYNFKKLIQTVNTIKFPYLHENTLTTLKLAVLNSLFNQLHRESLHLMFITEQVTFIEKALQLEGISIKKWPSLYDQPSLLTFLAHCHNSIILVSNPSKRDFEPIKNLLDEKIIGNINFTLWIVAEPNPDYKKELKLQKIDIIMDLSLQKNLNICRSIYDQMIDQRLESFIDQTNEIFTTAVKQKRCQEEQQGYSLSFQGIEQTHQQIQQENQVANQLLKSYFCRAREYKHVNQNQLATINKVATGFAAFRAYLRSKGVVSEERPKPNVLDSILAIFLQEETSRNKYSSSNTLFSNQISKLMLNQQDCELSFWNYEYGEDEQLGQSRRIVSRETMFKNMVGKLVSLIYHNQIW